MASLGSRQTMELDNMKPPDQITTFYRIIKSASIIRRVQTNFKLLFRANRLHQCALYTPALEINGYEHN